MNPGKRPLSTAYLNDLNAWRDQTSDEAVGRALGVSPTTVARLGAGMPAMPCTRRVVEVVLNGRRGSPANANAQEATPPSAA